MYFMSCPVRKEVPYYLKIFNIKKQVFKVECKSNEDFLYIALIIPSFRGGDLQP